MLQRQITIEHAAPWLVSSVSGLYIMARARRLSLSKATKDPLARFLFRQSDVMLMLCGCPALWYFTGRKRGRERPEIIRGVRAQAVHQLRQVFTALLVGTGLMARKASAGKTAELAALAQRLNSIVRDGIQVLATIGEPYPSDLLDEHGAPVAGGADRNGSMSLMH